MARWKAHCRLPISDNWTVKEYPAQTTPLSSIIEPSSFPMGRRHFWRRIPTRYSRDFCSGRGRSRNTKCGGRASNFGAFDGEVENLTLNISAGEYVFGPKFISGKPYLRVKTGDSPGFTSARRNCQPTLFSTMGPWIGPFSKFFCQIFITCFGSNWIASTNCWVSFLYAYTEARYSPKVGHFGGNTKTAAKIYGGWQIKVSPDKAKLMNVIVKALERDVIWSEKMKCSSKIKPRFRAEWKVSSEESCFLAS